VTVETRLLEQGRAKFVLEQSVLRGCEVLFRAKVTLAMVNARGRPQRIPSGLLERFRAPEAAE
jgi:acyl-CoA thioester hydrolase